MASRGDLALCLDTWLSASLATPGAMRNIIVNRCMNTDGIRTHRELSGHLALKKCEPEVLNYHLVRFNVFWLGKDASRRTSSDTLISEIEVFIPAGGNMCMYYDHSMRMYYDHNTSCSMIILGACIMIILCTCIMIIACACIMIIVCACTT